MIKNDLVKIIAAKFDFSLNLTGKIVQTFLDEIVNGLVLDSRIELRRFGVFGIKRQKARVITLPSGKKITRPAQKVVTFNPSSFVKKNLNPTTKSTIKRYRARKRNLPVAQSKF
jgi:integration host factor subunit beta